MLNACSVAQFEARLEANPQCKDVVNPKTGVLMPCPGSDKAFYREVGLAPAKTAPVTNGATVNSAVISEAVGAKAAPKMTPAQADCKPQIHKKTGGTMPCPIPD